MSGIERDRGLVVILVGRSPAESWLRREPGVELRRARTALDALGELAEIDEGVRPPLVLFAPGSLEGIDAPALLLALRKVNAEARIAALGSRADCPAMVDGEVDEENGGRSLWVAAESSPTSVTAAPASTPASNERAPARSDLIDIPLPSPVPPPDVRPRSETGSQDDEELLRVLLSGGDILGPCLDRMRRRLGSNAGVVRYALADDRDRGSADALAPVEYQGRALGVLIGPGALERELSSLAAWLAHWLALRDQHAQLRAAAFTDPLTGAWNRRYLTRFLDGALERARAKRHDVSLMLFDIDDFKKYNDRYGHSAGDEILSEVVRLLNSVIRPTDRVCRVGGDEFAVVFDEPAGPRDPRSQHPSSIHGIARRFQKQIQDHRFPKLGEEAHGHLTISAGMATFPWDAADAETLMERADRLLLDSKGQGKNALSIGPLGKQSPPGEI